MGWVKVELPMVGTGWWSPPLIAVLSKHTINLFILRLTADDTCLDNASHHDEDAPNAPIVPQQPMIQEQRSCKDLLKLSS
jgi:hypothetical protein